MEHTDIIVTFIDEGVFSSESSRLVVPRGTQLIGIWEDEQPEEGDACAIRINGELLGARHEEEA